MSVYPIVSSFLLLLITSFCVFQSKFLIRMWNSCVSLEFVQPMDWLDFKFCPNLSENSQFVVGCNESAKNCPNCGATSGVRPWIWGGHWATTFGMMNTNSYKSLQSPEVGAHRMHFRCPFLATYGKIAFFMQKCPGLSNYCFRLSLSKILGKIRPVCHQSERTNNRETKVEPTNNEPAPFVKSLWISRIFVKWRMHMRKVSGSILNVCGKFGFTLLARSVLFWIFFISC